MKTKQPEYEIYCRACHARPSYKNINTYLCEPCWKKWNTVRRNPTSAPADKEKAKIEVAEFIKSKGRYVWQPEVYIHFKSYTKQTSKECGMSAFSLCRDMGLYPPEDDLLVRTNKLRVTDYLDKCFEATGKIPGLRQLLKDLKMDYESLYTTLNYRDIAGSYGKRLHTRASTRFPDDESFLQTAAKVVIDHGSAMRMVDIMTAIEVSYPTYLEKFKHISPEEIHNYAGIARRYGGSVSFSEAEADRALSEMGKDFVRQASFPGLMGVSERIALRFDFYIPDRGLLIEVDGPQHYDTSNQYYSCRISEHDARKQRFAEENGLELCRIDLRKYKKPGQVARYLKNKLGVLKSVELLEPHAKCKHHIGDGNVIRDGLKSL